MQIILGTKSKYNKKIVYRTSDKKRDLLVKKGNFTQSQFTSQRELIPILLTDAQKSKIERTITRPL